MPSFAERGIPAAVRINKCGIIPLARKRYKIQSLSSDAASIEKAASI